jgi:hypothetical protein
LTPDFLNAVAAVLTPLAVIITGAIGYMNNRALRSIHTLVDGLSTQKTADIADLTARIATDNPRDKAASVAADTAARNLSDKQASDDTAKHSG